MANRTPLFNRVQPGGVYTISDIEEHPGDIWFVDSGSGTDAAGYGQNPDAPFATLDYAIGKCTASQGDVIYLLPGHAENLTAADSVDADVAGIKIIGLGWGSLKPTFSTTAAAGSFKVDAANVTVKNIKLLANFGTGTTVALTTTAAATDLLVEGVDFRDTSAANEFLLHVTIPTASGPMTFRNCSFVGILTGTMVRSVFFVGTSTDVTFEDCYWFVDSSDSVIDHSAGDSVNLRIARCTIINQDGDATGYCIENRATGTGVVTDCRMAYNNIGAEIGVGAATWWIENYASNTIAESGRLDPTTAHAIP